MTSSHAEYYIKEGQLLGRFEELYQDVDDPWECSADADALKNQLLLTTLSSLKLSNPTILDIGCGLGALTHKLYQTLHPPALHALDISETAIRKASHRYPAIHFACHDALASPEFAFASGQFDLICMSEILWCVLPKLEQILADLHRVCRGGGYLALMSGFLPPHEQTYGKDKIQHPQDVWRYLEDAGFQIRHSIELDHIDPQASFSAIIIAQKA